MAATVTWLTATGSKTSTEAADDKALDGPQKVEDRLWTDDEVEWRRQRGTVVEVTHPQFGPRELPLSVSVILSHQI